MQPASDQGQRPAGPGQRSAVDESRAGYGQGMATTPAAVGVTFDRSFPASLVTQFAREVDGTVDELWLIEDCFYTTAPPLAAAALAVTEELRVGLGILPAVARTAAVTAMEIATLASLAPGRVVGGIGHGVQSWMGQMGVRPASPLTALTEVLDAVRALLAGERLNVAGRYVTLDDVQLEHVPDPVPSVLAGVRGPKSMAVAGRSADGVLLADSAGPGFLPVAREQAGNPEGFQVSVFAPLITAPSRREAYRLASGWLADQLDAPTASLTGTPFYAELVSRYEKGGTEALAGVPADWWAELGAIGTLEDAAAHLAALERAGVDSVIFVPAPDPAVAREQLADVTRLAAR